MTIAVIMQSQQQQPPPSPPMPVGSTGEIRTRFVGDDVGLYFKQSATDPNEVECLLCSFKLKKENGDKASNSNSTTVLSDHLRVKHAIDRDEKSSTIADRHPDHNQQSGTRRHNLPQAQQDTNSIKKISNTKDTNQPRLSTSANGNINKPSNDKAIMTNHKHQRFKVPDGTSGKKLSSSSNQSKATNDINDLRRNLDLFDYDDLTKASLKPLPSSSLSSTLFSRLNQLSSPVTRKLKFWNKRSFQVNQYDPCFKVIYLGNLGMQFWSKDESCLEKPLNTLWNNYLVNMKTEIVMRLTICNSGLKAITRQHGLTQYWSNRLVYCCSHKNYPKIFSWIYRHEGKKMRQELRCHAVFCSSPERAAKMVLLLNQRLTCALQEFKREKKCGGCPPSIMANSKDPSNMMLTQQTLPRTVPLRRQILAKGSANFRPPLERSKSAPKLMSIREDQELEEEEEEEDEEEYGTLYDDVSHDEYEYEQSFGDRDDDDSDHDGETDDRSEKVARKESELNGDGDSSHRIDYCCKQLGDLVVNNA